tara:strand:+ start:533 stop:691 length:159 start_codon:yes stop_codon:yes gene_type:complete
MEAEVEMSTIILKSSDDKDFEVDIKIARMSETIKNMFDGTHVVSFNPVHHLN